MQQEKSWPVLRTPERAVRNSVFAILRTIVSSRLARIAVSACLRSPARRGGSGHGGPAALDTLDHGLPDAVRRATRAGIEDHGGERGLDDRRPGRPGSSAGTASNASDRGLDPADLGEVARRVRRRSAPSGAPLGRRPAPRSRAARHAPAPPGHVLDLGLRDRDRRRSARGWRGRPRDQRATSSSSPVKRRDAQRHLDLPDLVRVARLDRRSRRLLDRAAAGPAMNAAAARAARQHAR